MAGWVTLWKSMRILRWALWFGFLGYSLYFVTHREDNMNLLGQLLLTTEFALFGFPLAAVTAGFLELMFKARVVGNKEKKSARRLVHRRDALTLPLCADCAAATTIGLSRPVNYWALGHDQPRLWRGCRTRHDAPVAHTMRCNQRERRHKRAVCRVAGMRSALVSQQKGADYDA